MAALLGSVQAFSAFSSVCHIKFQDCLSAYNGKDIPVPVDAVAVHNEFKNCPPSVDFTQNVPPSIMLLIDDSNSTLFSDRNAVRFEVLDSLIEIISRTQPASRVGAAVFTGKLAWNAQGSNANGILQPLGQDASNAYLPIKPLNEQVGGRNYKAVLKEYLSKDPQENKFASWTNERASGTDITLAYDAARDAFANNQYSNGKDFDFIIFLSDGKAAVLDASRRATENDYRTCNKMTDVPTTFTVFLSASTGTAPDEIKEMNACIHNNGYSNSNDLSQLYFVVSDEKDKFLGIMRDEIMTEISSVQVSASVTLKSATIAGAALTKEGETILKAAKPIPLQPGMTVMDYRIVYGYQKNGAPADTVIEGTFSITRGQTNNWPNLVPQKIDKVCFDRSLSLNHAGAPIVPGEVINKDMTPITINAQLQGFEGNASAALATRFNRDRMNVSLTSQINNPGAFSGSFEHIVNDGNPSIGGKLEVDYDDTIKVTWRNPEIPLDTIMLANAFSTIAYPPFEYDVLVYPNPTRIDEINEAPLPGGSITFQGILLVVGPDTSLSADSIRTRILGASAIIYDDVGNTIARAESEDANKEDAFAYMRWNGRNLNGRKVSPGAYLADITVQRQNLDSGIKTQDNFRKMIGVKR
jgi:hypothetical protein